MSKAYQYSLLTLTADYAPQAYQLIDILQEESDTFTLGAVRDGQQARPGDASLPDRTWLVMANDQQQERAIGIASIDQQEVGIAILKEFQGQGLGKRTVKAMIAWAKQTGLPWLWLDVQAQNEVAIHLYQQFNFEFTGEDSDFTLPNGKVRQLRRMRLELV